MYVYIQISKNVTAEHTNINFIKYNLMVWIIVHFTLLDQDLILPYGESQSNGNLLVIIKKQFEKIVYLCMIKPSEELNQTLE